MMLTVLCIAQNTICLEHRERHVYTYYLVCMEAGRGYMVSLIFALRYT